MGVHLLHEVLILLVDQGLQVLVLLLEECEL
jgi:hypothetical protein